MNLITFGFSEKGTPIFLNQEPYPQVGTLYLMKAGKNSVIGITLDDNVVKLARATGKARRDRKPMTEALGALPKKRGRKPKYQAEGDTSKKRIRKAKPELTDVSADKDVRKPRKPKTRKEKSDKKVQ